MVNSIHARPEQGERLPDFKLPDIRGDRFDIYTFRGQWNLVLILSGYDDFLFDNLLEELIARQQELEFEDARVVLVAPGDSRGMDILRAARGSAPFLLLRDEGALIHKQLSAFQGDDRPGLTAFVTDRFGEIFAAIRPGDSAWPPGGEVLLDWLRFVEIQCPE